MRARACVCVRACVRACVCSLDLNKLRQITIVGGGGGCLFLLLFLLFWGWFFFFFFLVGCRFFELFCFEKNLWI